MATFNKGSRTGNSLKISIVGVFTNLIRIILGFGYRTIFIFLLSEVYLGIHGLFTSILQVLSLAELGITTAIVYRFYEPISREDVHYVGMLMNYFGKVYRTIALTILTIGLLLVPFLPFLINSSEQLPSDVNIYIVYILFLLNSVSSYIFAYKMTILTADQKNYITSVIDLIIYATKYLTQILTLCITKDYTLTLAAGIVATLIVNYAGSRWTEKQYANVFAVKEMLPKEDRNIIFSDTKACMCHKVGDTVLNSTDNILLTKMVSLAMTGLYSNYSMLLSYTQQFVNQILGSFTASVGNAIQTMHDEEYYKLYKKITFFGFWMAGIVAVGIYVVIDDFVKFWIGEKYVLNGVTTFIICLQLYISLAQKTTTAFINAAGLFVKDKVRPLIEATLNVVISVVLTHYIGIAGVFLGTIISVMLTVGWRNPYLLYKFCLKKPFCEYWKMYLKFFLISMSFCIISSIVKKRIVIANLIGIFAEGILAEIVINLLFLALFCKSDEFKGLKAMCQKLIKRA